MSGNIYLSHTTNPSDPQDIKAIHEYYMNLISHMPNNMYWLDKNCVTQGCNNNVLKFVGLEKLEDFVGITYEEMGRIANWTEEQAQSFKRDDMEVIATGKPKVNVEEPPFYDENGNVVHYLSTRMPLFDNKGEVNGVVGISIDITDLKLAEEREKMALLASAESKAKAQAEERLRQAVMVLTGSIAHDLRSPISVLEMEGGFLKDYLPILINGYDKAAAAQLMTGDAESIPSRIKNHLMVIAEAMRTTTREMHDFIDSTLKTLSKVITHDMTQDDLTICSMWHCIHNTLFRYPFAEGQRDLIEWDQQDFKFKGDGLMMIRVLFNLIKNSLEQIEKNQGGQIIISTGSDEQANIIRFKDTAGGAPPEVIEHLFVGYKTTKEKGTGVGLAFCKMAIETFGGTITCQSVYGEYIEFTLSFPKILEEK